MGGPTILIVDDNRSDLFLLQEYLEEWGYTTLPARSGVEALELFNTHTIELVISDRQMDEMDGIELLKYVKHQNPSMPFIMLTAHDDMTKAVAAMKHGADDYLSKGAYEPDEFQAKIARLLGYRLLRETPSQAFQAFRHIVTISPKMKNVFSFALKVAKTPKTTVLIEGESGTGKGLLALAIHQASRGGETAFVHVSCATIPPELLESELFGHVKGAFTGANRDKEGKFDVAYGGTLLLDEIGEMRFDLQVKLLRALQERSYEPVGSHKERKVGCRVICATNQNLRELLTKGGFREDLYYRITGFPISIPPLRERREDIPLLAHHFVQRFQKEHEKHFAGISEEAMKLFTDYDWPGNVRELENCIERAIILSDEGWIRLSHLATIPQTFQVRDAMNGPESHIRLDNQSVHVDFECRREEFSLDAVINHTLRAALNMCDNNVSEAAKLLGIGRQMFYRRGIITKDSD